MLNEIFFVEFNHLFSIVTHDILSFYIHLHKKTPRIYQVQMSKKSTLVKSKILLSDSEWETIKGGKRKNFSRANSNIQLENKWG